MDAIDELNKLFDAYLSDFLQKIKELSKQLKIYEAFKNYSEKKDIHELYKISNLIKDDQDITRTIAFANYLFDNKATKTQQYQDCVSHILESKYYQDIDQICLKLRSEKESYELECSKASIVKNNDYADFNYVSKVIDIMVNDNNKKLQLLSGLLYSICPERKKEVVENIWEKKAHELEKNNEELIRNIKMLKDAWYEPCIGRTKSQLEMKQKVFNLFEEEHIADDEVKLNEYIADSKEQLGIIILKMLELLSDLEVYQSESSTMEETTYNDYSNCYDKLQKLYTIAQKNISKLVYKEEKSIDDVYFYTDLSGNFDFDIENCSDDLMRLIQSHVVKLGNKSFDFNKGFKHSTVKNDYNLDYSVYVNLNKGTGFAVSYILLDGEIPMILTFGSIKDIYRDTNSLLYKEKDFINGLRILAHYDIDEFLNSDIARKSQEILHLIKDGRGLK